MEKKYFKLQLKSIFKVFPTILIITAVTLVCICMAGALTIGKNSDSEGKQKVKIGIVGNLENTYLDIGLYALQNLDSSRFYFEFTQFEEEEAIKKLNNHEISGYLHIPDGFVRSVSRGENMPCEYVTLNSPDNFGTIIAQEVTETVSDILTQSQVGMYSMQDVAHKYNKKNLGKNINNLTVNYANFILNRKTAYTLTTTGASDSLSLGGYYVCGLMMLFILFWGISSSRIFSSKKLSFSRIMKISGMRTRNQIMCEYGAYLTVSVMVLLIFALVFGIIVQFIEVPIPELTGISVIECLLFVIASLPVVMMVTMMQMAFYELIPNKIGAILMQLILAVGLGYISGCFYPNYFFPESVQTLAAYLPVGAGFSFLKKIMAGNLMAENIIIVLAYTFLFAFITVKMRECRMEGDSI